MRVKVRPARMPDLGEVCVLASRQGRGLTNLPAAPARMSEVLEASQALLAGDETQRRVFLVVEVDGQVAGVASVWSVIGDVRPFYSYRVAFLQQRQVGGPPIVRQTLTLTDEFSGCSEVGGLCIDTSLRGGGIGRLAARSRYLFMAQHRAMFQARTVSELRGWQDARGVSPFWEGLGHAIFRMPFDMADQLSTSDEDFIAPNLPTHPIGVEQLPQAAREALGRCHDNGRGALRMLLEEGFRDDGFVDIFDGGPTVWAPTDSLGGVKDSRVAPLTRVDDDLAEGVDSLVCAGFGPEFRAARGLVHATEDHLVITTDLARALDLDLGEPIRHVRF
jgi:arginine N-succinyltransferase